MAVEIALGDATRLGIECCDCGRNRWLRPSQLARKGVTLHTPLSEIAGKLTCSACGSDGLPGKNISVQAFFDHDAERIRAEAQVLKTQVVPSRGSLARGA